MSNNGEWWNYSWNVAPGCTRVGPECDHCWAQSMAGRLQGMKKKGYEGLVDSQGRWTGKVNLLYDRLDEPGKLTKPRQIAVNLMGDLFHPNVPESITTDVFKTMERVDRHTYMVLTKRPARLVEFIKEFKKFPIRNAWLGTTAGTQQSVNFRWDAMAWLAQAGWNTWVSSEPRLEAVSWHGWEFLKWMVTGGESGPYARPMSPEWVRADRDWCQAHKVAFWFKQWGEWGPSATHVAKTPGGGSKPPRAASHASWIDERNYPMTTMGKEVVFRFGRKLAGRELDGFIHVNGPEPWKAVL